MLDSFEDYETNGEVYLIAFTPRETEAGTIYSIKVKLQEPDIFSKGTRIGMSGDAKFLISQKENVFYLPNKFINSDIKGNYINLGSQNNKVYVKTGLEGEEFSEIIGDFKEGDKVFD